MVIQTIGHKHIRLCGLDGLNSLHFTRQQPISKASQAVLEKLKKQHAQQPNPNGWYDMHEGMLLGLHLGNYAVEVHKYVGPPPEVEYMETYNLEELGICIFVEGTNLTLSGEETMKVDRNDPWLCHYPEPDRPACDMQNLLHASADGRYVLFAAETLREVPLDSKVTFKYMCGQAWDALPCRLPAEDFMQTPPNKGAASPLPLVNLWDAALSHLFAIAIHPLRNGRNASILRHADATRPRISAAVHFSFMLRHAPNCKAVT